MLFPWKGTNTGLCQNAQTQLSKRRCLRARLLGPDLALQDHYALVEVVVLHRGCAVQLSQRGLRPEIKASMKLGFLLQSNMVNLGCSGRVILELESVVRASMVQIVAETCDHQRQDVQIVHDRVKLGFLQKKLVRNTGCSLI